MRTVCEKAGFTWVESAPGCYKVATRQLDWYSATAECPSYLHDESHLVAIKDAQEQTAVKEMLGQCCFVSLVFCTV